MAIERLELPDGQWADQLVKPRHAEYVAITKAAEAAEAGESDWTEWALTVGREFTKRIHIVDEEGDDLPVADWSKADPDITDAICTEAQNRYRDWQVNRPVPLVAVRQPKPKSRTNESSSSDT